VKVPSDTDEAFDEGSPTALIMLDLSAAFDVIDIPTPVRRFEVSFSFRFRS